MKNIKLVGLAGLASVLLSGCGMITNGVVSDQSIQKRAAFALGVRPNDLIISNRSGDIDSVHFFATMKKTHKVYQCYYTSALVVNSDALCNSTDGTGLPSQQCNALTRAAGKCR